MKIFDAKKLALKLMREHGLTEEGWTFRFDRGRNSFGRCSVRRNRFTGEIFSRGISISKKLTENNDVTHVLDTILHEIAHAIVGHKAGHGPIWQREALRIGARPVACFTDEEVNVSYKWHGTCRDCDRLYKRHKLTNGLLFSVHSICKNKEYKGELVWKKTA